MAVSKRTGRKSVIANDFLVPLPPGPPEAFDVGTNRPFDNGSAVVNFSLSVGAASYKVYSNSAGQPEVTATGTSTPIVVTGLKSNILYTFTVTSLSEAGAESDPSEASVPTLITSVPATPAAPTAASPNANQDVVSWGIPNSGGKTITGYIWNASDGKSNAIGGNPGGGPTTNTSVTINQEAGTAQTYTVYAINPNGNSLTSAQSNAITTTFSFAPFGFSPFGFTPFAFTPFSFTPFMFAPFMFAPFMFAPFMFAPFGFIPFMFTPRDPPRCIAEDTEIATLKDDKVVFVKAKELLVGQKVVSPIWDELKLQQGLTPYEERLEYQALTNKDVSVGNVIYILKKDSEETVIFNNDASKEYSMTQPVLARKSKMLDAWEFTKDLEVGDYIWEYDFDLNIFKEVLISSIEIKSSSKNVYQISVDNVDTFIAGNIICHNK
jgi:hypothetical protein